MTTYTPDDPTGIALTRRITGEEDPGRPTADESGKNTHPAHEALARDLARIYDLIGHEARPATVDAAWASVAQSLSHSQPPVQPSRRQSTRQSARSLARRSTRIGMAGLVAAVGVVVFGVAGYWKTQDSISDPWEYTTERGQRASLELPDGSRLVLAPGSHVTYREERGGARHLALEGQAYFNVQHDPQRTFSVSAAGVTTRVLGTAFSVQAYPEDTATQVVVAEGRVAVSSGNTSVASPMTVLAGNAVLAVAGGSVHRMPDMSLTHALGWTNGWIAFTNTPLRDAIPRLEREYNLDIFVDDSLLTQRRMTLTLTSESSAEALQTIATVLDLSVTQSGQQVVFHAKP